MLVLSLKQRAHLGTTILYSNINPRQLIVLKEEKVGLISPDSLCSISSHRAAAQIFAESLFLVLDVEDN